MEYTLEVFPEVGDSDSWDNFYEKDYTNFSEEINWYEQPQLR